MEIGSKLKKARIEAGLTQEKVAEEIGVSRQTISNWENERFFPDIVSVIKLSNLYNISLDNLLKGDEQMMQHLKESTNIVNSNKKLILSIILTGLLLIILTFINGWLVDNKVVMLASATIAIISTTALFYQVIKRI